MPPAAQSHRRTPLTIGCEAVRANALPAFVIQALMLTVLAAYYLHPPFTELLNRAADVKRVYGLAFVVVATVLAGSILPELLVITLFQRGRVHMQNL
ncbi:MAG TPA: hypothetical protein VK993_02450, partial [Chthoniobacterales bacterium]|nr:hypothetical protein [Chthoniobacterales bacterium]